MYKLMYYYILKLAEKRSTNPKLDAVIFVWVTQGIHVFFILAVVRKLLGITILPTLSDTAYFNKLYAMPFAIIWFLFTKYYYNKHSNKIIELYSQKKILTWKNSLIVFSLLLVPLGCFIALSTK